jgi:CelD/BcsL family acetyltransferase involved in cellulose biosynthesis
VEPIWEIPLRWPDLPSYFRSLTKKMRSNISRQARRLYAAGAVELIVANGPAATTAWFAAYCDLDDRSWKSGTPSSIRRHARRERLFREVVMGRAGFDPWFVGVILDGVLVSGLIVGSNASATPGRYGAWCLEMAYDRTRADLGPGQLLLLLAVGEAIKRGDQFLNFMQNFAYYKHRWGAESIEVVNVQVLRRVSLHNTGATAAELRRWLLQMRAKRVGAREFGAAPDAYEPEKNHGEEECGSSGPPPDLKKARALTAAALTHAGPGVVRLDRAGAGAHLPFPIE